MHYDISGLSDIGTVRSSNQDVVAWQLGQDGRQALLLVADGMGGYHGGDIASRLAMESVLETMAPRLQEPTSSYGGLSDDAIRMILQDCVTLANDSIIEGRAGDASLDKMGTTLVMAWVIEGRGHVAHVGDSRCYLLQGRRVTCLTRDDTVVQDMLDDGSIAAIDVPHMPFRNVLTRALGAPSSIRASYQCVKIGVGDRLLLCSDGLTNALPDQLWPDILDKYKDTHSVAEAMVNASLDNRAADNVSVVLLTRN
ncbi:serine/threonine protein phosphatase [Marinobacter lipolyticus SM19]|uniref:Serine/threonine protein phosphatase n=1 Tax=Marinobacter lipolyticus SM19 TaxID=1318628 RepID=R8AZ46_9GAMM|nr:protein phosphatase 2C domain-containing protein [Marinobacter lipolyticus]EON91606.1 serine/threonine protein phosphatase [Marinobacter lipolyticus SM19]